MCGSSHVTRHVVVPLGVPLTLARPQGGRPLPAPALEARRLRRLLAALSHKGLGACYTERRFIAPRHRHRSLHSTASSLQLIVLPLDSRVSPSWPEVWIVAGGGALLAA